MFRAWQKESKKEELFADCYLGRAPAATKQVKELMEGAEEGTVCGSHRYVCARTRRSCLLGNGAFVRHCLAREAFK